MFSPTENPRIYNKLLHQKRETELFLSALRLNLFSYLETWKTPEEIAQRTGWNERNLYFYLNAIACIGLLEKNEKSYRNTPQSNEFLHQSSPIYLGECLLFREKMMSLENLDERIMEGPDSTIYQNNKGVEVYDFHESARVSIPEMYTGRVQSLVKNIQLLCKDNPPNKILDLGGGSGILALETVSAFPNCNGVVFEHHSVAELPRHIIAEHKLSERICVMEGDFTTDEIGKGYDLIIASGILDFAKDHLDALMEKIKHALTPNGYLYIVTHGVQEDYQRPQETILGWLSGHLDGLDVLLTKKIIDEELTKHNLIKIPITDNGETLEGFQGAFYCIDKKGA